MINKHKQARKQKRKVWKKIITTYANNSDADKPLNYPKLSKYEKKKAYKYRKSLKINGKSLGKKENIKNRKTIELKENIDFEENVESIVAVTKDVNHYIKKYLHLGFSLDHKHINTITVGGLLYLVGQISKITSAKYNDGEHHLKYNKKLGLKNDERIRYLFHQIGYWSYFRIPRPYALDKCAKSNYFLSIETDTKSNVDLLNKIKYFVNDNINLITNDYDIEYQFDDIIKEAMGNSIEHAYPDDFEELGKTKGKWWICGHYDKQKETLELVLYDYGVGIRESMKLNLGEDAKIAFIDTMKDKVLSDADLIEMAINGDLSKYKNYQEEDRGKGFKKFKKFAKSTGYDCELTLVSNTGKYKISYNAATKAEIPVKTKLSSNIDGMLVKWKIYLNKGAVNG